MDLRTSDILHLRGAKNDVSPTVPYAFHCENERSSDGSTVDVATIFLTNRECPFRCLMCDLWKNTLDKTVPSGAIPTQMRYALERLDSASHIKLYNSGNFFDKRAIPPADFREIAAICDPFTNVVVETHPLLCGTACLDFRDMLSGALEIAMGLETIDPAVTNKLNKRMSPRDFARSSQYLANNGIRVRAFILLKPPFTSDLDGVEWAIRSAEFAFDAGVECCVVIPTRRGNGAVDFLERNGHFSPPTLASLEQVANAMIPRPGKRFFVDLWDARAFATCDVCAEQRIHRLSCMNLTQRQMPPVRCGCNQRSE